MQAVLDHELSEEGLKQKHLLVLQMLVDEECVYPSTIVKNSKITFPELTRILDKLEIKGYLSRSSYSCKDRRRLSLEILPRGERLVQNSRDILSSLPRSLVSSLTEQEKQALMNFLQTFPKKP